MLWSMPNVKKSYKQKAPEIPGLFYIKVGC